MNNAFYTLVTALLLLNLLAGLWRIYRGPSPADRLLAVQLFTTTSVAVLLLLAQVQALPALLDVALLIALLAAIANLAFVRLPGATIGDRQ
ncbi:MAG: monovalent cation/H+ antiporter complex subunit F [Candidatus Competibacteraceae bacterium]|nr:monovalent cation/H+ antiporter complex subunit F [Candidatus Competibacteraceae bacterium]